MLGGLGIDEQEQEACVEKLGVEYTVGDGGLLLTLGVFPDPVNQVDDNQLQNDVYPDDDESN